MDKIKLFKLARLVMHFGSVTTDKGVLMYEGDDIQTDLDVTMEDSNGEVVIPEDGEYKTEDKLIIVKDGKVESVTDIVKEDETVAEEMEEEVVVDDVVEQTQPDEKDVKIAELESIIEELKSENEQLKTRIAELENEQLKPVEDAVVQKPEVDFSSDKKIGALKYFH